MNLLATIAGLIGGPINAALGLVSSTMQEGFKAAIQFHKEGIAFARDVGLSAKQAQAYTNVLIERTQVLANKYGVSAEAIMQVQRGITEATGKQLLLNDAQAEGFVQINKLIGAQSASKFTEEIMNGMGGQIDTVQGAIAKVYATASKQGLNAKKLTDKVAQNLSMANRLSFRNGIDGLTRMAAMSEKLGINMSSVESAAANNFMDLDKAIENAASLQMLGGSVGTMAGNPLTMSYEANYDPEAFAKRMSDSLASYATFDKNKGVANINGGNMMFIREIAKAMGISTEEASRMAKKRAEVEYKENKFGRQLNALGLSEEQKNFIINNGQVTNNGNDLEINGKNINQLTPDDLKNMMQFEGMSDRDILEEQAKSLISIDEQITGAASSVAAAFAKGIDGYLPDIGNNIQKLGEYLQGYAEQWGKDTGQVIGKAMHWINGNGDKIKSAADSILGIITNTYHWFADGGLYKILLGFGGYLLAKWGIGKLLEGGIKNSTTRSGANALKGIFTTSRDTNIATRMGYADARAAGNGRIMSALKAPFRGASLLSTGQKVANVGGAALGVGISAVQGIMAQSAYKDQLEAINRGEWDREKYRTKEEAVAGAQTERNSAMGGAIGGGVGTVIGTVLGGPVGAMIGGAIGKFAGEYIGKNWTKITEWMAKGWNKFIGGLTAVGGWIKDKWNDVVGWFKSVNWSSVGKTILTILFPPARAIMELVEHWSEVKDWFKNKWDGAVAAISDGWNSIKEGWNTYVAQPAKDLWDSIKGLWNDYVIQPVKDLWNTVRDGWDKITKGIKKFLDNPWETVKEGAKGAWENAKNWVKDTIGIGERHANGGIVGGTSYSGDKVLTGLNSGEMVLNKQQQANLFAAINNLPAMVTSILVNRNDVRAKEYGANKEYIYVPNRSETSNVNGNQITVKDFNINLTGTIKLDGGNNSKNVDVNSLLSDRQFINNLKELIKNSINEDMNGGRVMNDRGTFLNHPSSYSVW